LLSLRREVNRLFNDGFCGFGGLRLAGPKPNAACRHVELGESDTEIRVTPQLPGFHEKDVAIITDDGMQTLTVLSLVGMRCAVERA
jgi:HSP20 family protein